MGQQFAEISESARAFIEEQHLFFVGTATADGRINVSPKGMDSLRVVGTNRVVWLNATGSGNETSAHVQENPRMTIMFSSFVGNPMILRLYGTAEVVHRNDKGWAELDALFEPLPGTRQYFDMAVELVQNSCGMGVPLLDYVGERESLIKWAEKHGESGLQDYWKKKNQVSIDGQATNIIERNLPKDS